MIHTIGGHLVDALPFQYKLTKHSCDSNSSLLVASYESPLTRVFLLMLRRCLLPVKLQKLKPKTESLKPEAGNRNLVQCITERVMEFANSIL